MAFYATGVERNGWRSLLPADHAGIARLAADLGVAAHTVWRWRAGVHRPRRHQVPRLARALGMPADELSRRIAADRAAKGGAR